MKNVRSVIKEIIDTINNNEKMSHVLDSIDALSVSELSNLEETLSLLATKTDNPFIIGRLLMLKNQVRMTRVKKGDLK